MRHHGEEARLGAARGLGGVARLGQRTLGLDAVGDVAADALDFGVLGLLGPDHDVAPGEPARAVGGHDLLVVQPRAVRQHAGAALLQRRQRIGGAEQRLARRAGQGAIGVVDVGDAALAVAADDQIALRFEQARRARLGLLQLPGAVGQLLAADLGALELHGETAVARQHDQHDAAEQAEQAADADREQGRIVDRFVDAIEMREQHRCGRDRADDDERPAQQACISRRRNDSVARRARDGTNLHRTHCPLSPQVRPDCGDLIC